MQVLVESSAGLENIGLILDQVFADGIVNHGRIVTVIIFTRMCLEHRAPTFTGSIEDLTAVYLEQLTETLVKIQAYVPAQNEHSPAELYMFYKLAELVLD